MKVEGLSKADVAKQLEALVRSFQRLAGPRLQARIAGHPGGQPAPQTLQLLPPPPPLPSLLPLLLPPRRRALLLL